MVIINSFNEFAEQTAVEPARTDNVWDPWPSQYYFWDMTKARNLNWKL